MAEPTALRIRELRLRVDRDTVAGLTEAALRTRIVRQLPANVDRALAEAVAAELGRAVRTATRRYPGGQARS